VLRAGSGSLFAERRSPSPTVAALRRLLRNPAGVIGLVGLTTLLVAALGADVLAAIMGPGVVTAAVGINNMPTFSRLTRAGVLSEKEKEYVLAAKAAGVSDWRIAFRHILPNCVPPLLVQLALAMAFAALLEAALSFLGLGAQPPAPSWGSMLSKAQGYLRLSPWFGIFPGLALALLLISLNFLADGLRDVLDPRRAGLD